MDSHATGRASPQQDDESISDTTNILSTSENTNNENREKELNQTDSNVVELTEEVKDSIRDEEEKIESAVDDAVSSPPDNFSTDEYHKNVTYNDDGIAIYTDPKTNFQYKWSEEKSSWESIDNTGPENVNNPFENEHYRWCSETNQWIPKTSSTSGSDDKLENDYYKWDKETNKWIPKTQSSDVTSSFEDGVHTYTDKDGAVYFWDVEKNAWFPKIDDDFMARYQLNYGFIDNTSSTSVGQGQGDELQKSLATVKDDSVNPLSSEKAGGTGENRAANKRKAPEPPKWFDIPPEQNTKVYVSNLPLDITEEEFVQVMSKCGLLMRDPKTQKNKVKLYTEPDGQLKGDGLCDYIKVESVDLALKILDGSDVRGHTIKVQQAKFRMRGEYNPALKPKKKKKDKEKLQKMKEKLFDWRPEKMRGERSKHEKVVIIKNLFSPELFDTEVHLILDYQNDLREECTKCGVVRKVVIYDRHPEGVAQITMSDPDEADLVVKMMHGRFFGKRKLTAEIWDGKTKYKIAETEADHKQRLNKWDQFLETAKTAKDEDDSAKVIDSEAQDA